MTRDSVLKIAPEVEAVETGLKSESRSRIAKGVLMVLADTFVLMFKSQAFHWNIVGPAFFGLHKMTETHYNNLFQATDKLGERVRALGFPTPISFAALNAYASISESGDAETTEEMVHELAECHEKAARQIRDVAEIAKREGDDVTADMLTGRLAFHEEAVWMLKSVTATNNSAFSDIAVES